MESLLARAGGGANRRAPRPAATPAERMLWGALRKRRLEGIRFRRRHAIGPFVLDFYCAKAALAVALDADPDGARAVARDAALAAAGLRVLGFQHRLVERNLAGVVAGIRAAVRRRVGRRAATR